MFVHNTKRFSAECRRENQAAKWEIVASESSEKRRVVYHSGGGGGGEGRTSRKANLIDQKQRRNGPLTKNNPLHLIVNPLPPRYDMYTALPWESANSIVLQLNWSRNNTIWASQKLFLMFDLGIALHPVHLKASEERHQGSVRPLFLFTTARC